jgi:hypothetical protein
LGEKRKNFFTRKKKKHQSNFHPVPIFKKIKNNKSKKIFSENEDDNFNNNNHEKAKPKKF